MGYAVYVAAVAIYGVYHLWRYYSSEDEYFESLATPKNSNNEINCRVLVLGLDDSGKTRFTKCFRKGKQRIETTEEKKTMGVYVNSTLLGAVRLHMWDVGGSVICRSYWKDFLTMDFNVICFVVDSSNGPRFKEANYALRSFLDLKTSHGIPLVLVASKQDKEYAVDPNAVYRKMEIQEYAESRPIYFVPVQAPDHGQRKGFMTIYRLFSTLGESGIHKKLL